MSGLDRFENHLQDLEFQILVPTMALLSCAHSRAAELGGGFGIENDSVRIVWPDEVMRYFGLKPAEVFTPSRERNFSVVRFEPVLGSGNSYWKYLFVSGAPDLVVGYEVSLDRNSSEPPVIHPIDEEWLHWTWHVRKEDRLTALEEAVGSYEQLSDAVGWPSAARKSAMEGPRSILFTEVSKYFTDDHAGRELDG